MENLLRCDNGNDQLELSQQLLQDLEIIRLYANDILLNRRQQESDHLDFGFFVRSLLTTLSTELQFLIWTEIYRICQISEKLKENSESAVPDAAKTSKEVFLIAWIQDKTSCWKALLHGWDDLCGHLSSEQLEEHCDPDATREVEYVIRLFISSQKELFSQLSCSMNKWAMQVSKESLSEIDQRSNFLSTFIDFVTIHETLLELWRGNDPATLLQVKSTLPKFSSVVWTIRSAKHLINALSRSEEKKKQFDIERTRMLNPWSILTTTYSSGIATNLIQTAAEESNEFADIGQLLEKEFHIALEAFSSASRQKTSEKWAIARQALQERSVLDKENQMAVWMAQASYNFVVHFIVKSLSLTHQIEMTFKEVRSPLINQSVHEEGKAMKSLFLRKHSLVESRRSRAAVPKKLQQSEMDRASPGSETSRGHKIINTRQSGVGAIARMFILVKRVREKWDASILQVEGNNSAPFAEESLSILSNNPLASISRESNSSRILSEQGTPLMLPFPLVLERISSNETRSLCTLIKETEEMFNAPELLQQTLMTQDISSEAYHFILEQKAVEFMSANLSQPMQQSSNVHLQNTTTKLIEFYDLVCTFLTTKADRFPSLANLYSNLKTKRHILLTVLHLSQEFSNWLANIRQYTSLDKKLTFPKAIFSDLRAMIDRLLSQLSTPDNVQGENEVTPVTSMPVLPAEVPNQKDDFKLDRGFTQNLCVNPIYRENTTASSLQFSMGSLPSDAYPVQTHEEDPSLCYSDFGVLDSSRSIPSTLQYHDHETIEKNSRPFPSEEQSTQTQEDCTEQASNVVQLSSSSSILQSNSDCPSSIVCPIIDALQSRVAEVLSKLNEMTITEFLYDK